MTIMIDNKIMLAKILTYCGALPFIISILLIYFPFGGLDGEKISQTYSAIIISFLSGIHWAASIFFTNKNSPHLLLMSNIITLAGWVSLFLTNSVLVTIVQASCFLFLLLLDLKLYKATILPEWFYKLRQKITVIVVSCLFTITISSL